MFRAVDDSIRRLWMIVNFPPQELSASMRTARHRAVSANPRQTGPTERQQPERIDRLQLGNGSLPHKIPEYHSRIDQAKKGFRERPLRRHCHITDSVIPIPIIESIVHVRSEMNRVVSAKVDARKMRPDGDCFDRKFASGEILRGRRRPGARRHHVHRMLAQPVSLLRSFPPEELRSAAYPQAAGRR